eukprot:4422490-Prymnesium_polylepis.1
MRTGSSPDVMLVIVHGIWPLRRPSISIRRLATGAERRAGPSSPLLPKCTTNSRGVIPAPKS